MSFRGFAVVLAAVLAAGLPPAHGEDALPKLPDMPPPRDPDAGLTQVPMTESVAVELDRASVIRIPADTATLALGNPAIADLTQPRAGAFAVVTGKSYGTTNMLALDRSGGILQEVMITVRAPAENVVTVLRGGARETWSCKPRCEPTVMLGDSAEYFGGTTGQIGSRNGLAGEGR